jgi:type I restriction enzyme S subunit
MDKYSSYKDSGVEWIGKIPSHWNSIPLKYFLERNKNSIRTGPFGSSLKSTDMIDNGVRIYNQRTVYDEDFTSGKIFVSQEKFESLKGFTVLNGDILISSRGTIGKMTVVPEGSDIGVLHPCLIRLRVDENKTNKKFLWWYMNHSSLFLESVKLESNSTTIEVIYSNVLSEIHFPLPPLFEQLEIVSYFERRVSLIDSLLQKKQRKIEILKEKRTSLINHVVTKGLDGNVEMKDSGVEWIGEIPSHWETTRFKYKGEVIIGLSYKPDDVVSEEEGILVMRSSNVQNGQPSFHDNVYVNTNIPEKLITKEGDILICSRNGSRRLIGKNCLITKDIKGMSWGVFMTMYRSPSYKFFYWLLNSPVFESQSGLFLTSTINQLTVSTLENMVVPFVSDEIEQQQIVEYLDEQTEEIDTLIKLEQNKIKLLKEYRQSLISEVVTGKIRVCKEDHSLILESQTV